MREAWDTWTRGMRFIVTLSIVLFGAAVFVLLIAGVLIFVSDIFSHDITDNETNTIAMIAAIVIVPFLVGHYLNSLTNDQSLF